MDHFWSLWITAKFDDFFYSLAMQPSRLIDMSIKDKDSSKNPQLLSGGNPQISKGDGREFVDAYRGRENKWTTTLVSQEVASCRRMEQV